jgi:hypothetical protein
VTRCTADERCVRVPVHNGECQHHLMQRVQRVLSESRRPVKREPAPPPERCRTEGKRNYEDRVLCAVHHRPLDDCPREEEGG